MELLRPRTFRYMDLLRGTHILVAPASRETLHEAVLAASTAPDPVIETLRS